MSELGFLRCIVMKVPLTKICLMICNTWLLSQDSFFCSMKRKFISRLNFYPTRVKLFGKYSLMCITKLSPNLQIRFNFICPLVYLFGAPVFTQRICDAYLVSISFAHKTKSKKDKKSNNLATSSNKQPWRAPNRCRLLSL